jgi:hypothetical protein
LINSSFIRVLKLLISKSHMDPPRVIILERGIFLFIRFKLEKPKRLSISTQIVDEDRIIACSVQKPH